MFAARNQLLVPASVKQSYSYNFNTNVKPAGMVEDAHHASMLPLNVGSNRLNEKTATGGSNNYWYGEYPGLMNTLKYRATVTVGNQSSGTDRGALVWVGGKGTNGIENSVWFRIRGQGGLACVIATKTGLGTATITLRVSGANTLVVPGDTIGLEVSENPSTPGTYRYQGLKNGVPIASAIWNDTTGIFGVPGKAWGCGGYGIFSGGSYFSSLGIYAMECIDL